MLLVRISSRWISNLIVSVSGARIPLGWWNTAYFKTTTAFPKYKQDKDTIEAVNIAIILQLTPKLPMINTTFRHTKKSL